MRLRTCLVGLCLIVTCAVADEPGNRRNPPPLVFAAHGFSINPLDQVGEGTVQVLLMAMPVTENFAPNVNVQVQPFDGDIAAYAELSNKQFEQLQLTVIEEKKLGTTGITWEYAGVIPGTGDLEMHFYARAEQVQGKIILATGGAKASQWEAVGGKLKACVDSLRLTAAAPKPR